MKLKSEKCTFGIKDRKFLGYIVLKKDIEANLESIKEILDMEAPIYFNDI